MSDSVPRRGRTEAEPTYDPPPPPAERGPHPSGDADVDAQLGRLADTDHLATDGHVEVYEM